MACSTLIGKQHGILMFAFPNTGVSDGKWISRRNLPIPAMPQTNGLSDLQERILLAVWKLRGIGSNNVDQTALKAEMTNEPSQNLTDAIGTLYTQGFLEKTSTDDRTAISLTPLGLAILRKIEEDRLQELK
jgi:predicted transcriptional regulator